MHGCWAVFVDGSATYSYLQYVITHTHTHTDTYIFSCVFTWCFGGSSVQASCLLKHIRLPLSGEVPTYTLMFFYIGLPFHLFREQEIQVHNTLVLQRPKVECKNLVVMNWILPLFSFISRGKFSSSVLFFGYGAECDVNLRNTWNI